MSQFICIISLVKKSTKESCDKNDDEDDNEMMMSRLPLTGD